MKPANFAPIYVTLYPPLADIAREHGYSLAVHGSVASDFDLIAIPWVETPKPADELVAAFARRLALLEGTFGTSMDTEPELKPHGRRAWNLYIGGMAKLDLSVMPADPSKIDALVEALQAEVDRLTTLAHGQHIELYNARLKLDAIEKQEPVAYRLTNND
jgi:hypothetical protein